MSPVQMSLDLTPDVVVLQNGHGWPEPWSTSPRPLEHLLDALANHTLHPRFRGRVHTRRDGEDVFHGNFYDLSNAFHVRCVAGGETANRLAELVAANLGSAAYVAAAEAEEARSAQLQRDAAAELAKARRVA